MRFFWRRVCNKWGVLVGELYVIRHGKLTTHIFIVWYHDHPHFHCLASCEKQWSLPQPASDGTHTFASNLPVSRHSPLITGRWILFILQITAVLNYRGEPLLFMMQEGKSTVTVHCYFRDDIKSYGKFAIFTRLRPVRRGDHWGRSTPLFLAPVPLSPCFGVQILAKRKSTWKGSINCFQSWGHFSAGAGAKAPWPPPLDPPLGGGMSRGLSLVKYKIASLL